MIFSQLTEQLNDLRQLLTTLTPSQFGYKARYLSGSTIGGHTRHIIELLGCAVSGYAAGKVDYHNRTRNMLLEQDIDFAMDMLTEINNLTPMPDKPLVLVTNGQEVMTTYYREVVYNIEHTIHHLALIKVALLELECCEVNDNFGVAYSTIQFRKAQPTISA